METIAALYDIARNLIKQLRPEIIDVLGLTGALQEMVREYNQLRPEIHFVLRTSPEFPSLRGELAMTAYRLVQEALSNVIKHAEASVVAVKLIWNVGDSSVQIMVCDDGKGFDTNAQPSGSVGLIGMRERVTAIGGSIRIESNESSGTKVIFGLPLNPPDQRVS